MIVRKDSEGNVTLIGLTDHAQLVGQLAAHWGNSKFETPKPYESVVRAAAYHDYGWLAYETGPMVNGQTGLPYEFFQVPSSQSQLDAYQWAIDWMATVDRYSALIMSMHRTGLWKGRYGSIKYPTAFNIPNPGAELRGFIERNEAAQERERKSVDQGELATNYWLMQVWDLLGLYFCCKEPINDYIDGVPLKYGARAEEGVKLSMAPRSAHTVAFEPYPFDARPCHIQVRARRVPAGALADDRSFRQAYFKADALMMDFELV
jgi:hypothetical protein